MKPKEKAIELVNKFIDYVNCWDDESADPNYTQAYNYAKQCALIAVEEVLNSRPSLPIEAFGGSINMGECIKLSIQYWQEVKQEIEKL